MKNVFCLLFVVLTPFIIGKKYLVETEDDGKIVRYQQSDIKLKLPQILAQMMRSAE